MMLVKRLHNSSLPLSVSGRALVLGLTLLCVAARTLAWGQASELPSTPNPNPNPSSISNPFYGSVTLHAATSEVLPLSLEDAIHRGLETNLGLKQKEEAEKQFNGELLEAVQLFLPSITVSGGTALYEYNLAAFGFGPGTLKKFGALFPNGVPPGLSLITKADVTTGQINYEQSISFPVVNGYKAVRAAQRSAYFSKETARGEVVQQVAGAYLGVIAAQSEVENAQTLLKADQVLLDHAQAQHAAGVAANLDELRAKVQYQQQEQAVLAAKNKREKSEILLKREIGLAPGQQVILTDPAPYSELALQTPEELRAVAYENRQDYQNLKSQLRETQMALAARRQERLPSLSFKGNYGVTGVNGAGYHGTLSAVGTLSMPIFREATLRGDRDVARAQLHGVELQIEDEKGRIDQQVRSALLDVQAAQQLVAVARSSVDLATQALADETDRFNAGIDDTLPLVQAQATLQGAQSNLVESLYQFNLSKLGLARSAGVLELQYRAYLGK